MDAGDVTTARTVMRPAHPMQRLTSTSKVRRKRVAQSSVTAARRWTPLGDTEVDRMFHRAAPRARWGAGFLAIKPPL